MTRTVFTALAALASITLGLPAAAAPAELPGHCDEARTEDGRVLVATRGRDAAEVGRARAALVRAPGASIRDFGPDARVVAAAVPEHVAARLVADGDVHCAVQFSATRTPTDPAWGDQVGSRQARLPRLWDASVGRSAVTVAVLDEGVARHPDLAANLREDGASFVGGFSTDWEEDPQNVDGTGDTQHGTPVAGIVAASANDQYVAGTCWTCRILPVKVLDRRGTGFGHEIALGLDYAVAKGARVVNMSFSGPTNDPILASAIRDARAQGVVLVAAAGNNGGTDDQGTVQYPAANPGVISVGATRAGSDQRASFSSTGSWVDVAAPGILVSTATGITRDGQEVTGTVNFAGTSAAAPLVSGIAAILLSANPQMTNAELRRALLGTTRPLPWVATGAVDSFLALRASFGTQPLAGDLDGDGVDDVAWYHEGRTISVGSSTKARTATRHGAWTDTALIGDWDGDGRDELITHRGNIFRLDDALTGGLPEDEERFGSRGDQPLVGNLLGAAEGDQLVVRRGNTFHVQGALGDGAAALSFSFGKASDDAMIGDWNGDGIDDVVIRRGNTWYFDLNTPSTRGGGAERTYRWGSGSDTPVLGDWDGDGDAEPGLRRDGHRWYRLADSASRSVSRPTYDAALG